MTGLKFPRPGTPPPSSYGQWVIQYRWWIVLFTLLTVGAAGSGVRFLTFTTDYRVFFSKDNPQLRAFEVLQNTYTKNDNVLFAIAPGDGKVFTRETLAAIEELTQAAWQIPYSIRVDSITNFQYTWATGDDLVVEDLVKNARNLSDADLQRIKKIALAEPLLVNRLIAPSAKVTGINVTINLPGKSLPEVPKVAAFARRMVAAIHKTSPDIHLYLSGVVLLPHQFVAAVPGDLKSLVPLMYLLVLLVLAILLRSFTGTVTTVIVIIFADLTAMGLAGWMGFQITTVSSFAPAMVLSLAVADSIHILVKMIQEMRFGKSKHEALIESLHVNMQPVFLTSLTTAIGFLSLNFSDSPPYRDLGNIVAMGVTAAYVYSVLFLPAIIAILPFKVKIQKSDKTSTMHRLGEFVVKNRNRLYWGILIFSLALTAQIPRNEINDKFTEYFDTRYAFRTDSDFIADHLTGFMFIDYSLSAGEAGGISNPEYLAKLEEFAEWNRKQPGVVYVSTLTDVMKRLNRNMHGDDDAYFRLPESRELAAQYLLLYEMSLPYGLDLNNQINIDKSSTRLSVVLENISSKEMLALEKRARAWLEKNAPESMVSHGASPLIMFAHIAKRNVHSMLGGTAFAVVLISIVLIVALRSVKYGLISLITNIFPAALAFGVWGILVGRIGMAAALVAAMSLGIVVDDTVHFLSKYKRSREEMGLNPEEAVIYSFQNVGTALWVTSLILVMGFLVLNFSGFLVNAQMGLLTGIAITFALFIDFLFLPPLLIKLESKTT